MMRRALGLVAVLVLAAGCAERARTVGDRTLERIERPTADGGKIITERERTQVDEDRVTKADLAVLQETLTTLVAGLQGNLPGALAKLIPSPPAVPSVDDFARAVPRAPTADEVARAVPRPAEPPKILGMDLNEVIMALAGLWAAERGVSVWHKRRRPRLESKAKE